MSSEPNNSTTDSGSMPGKTRKRKKITTTIDSSPIDKKNKKNNNKHCEDDNNRNKLRDAIKISNVKKINNVKETLLNKEQKGESTIVNNENLDKANDVNNVLEKLINESSVNYDENSNFKITSKEKDSLEQSLTSTEENDNTDLQLLDESGTSSIHDKSVRYVRTLSRKDSNQFCRICHEIGTSDVFISPCNCKGSLSLVHKWCLERWLAESDTNHCELCGFIFNLQRKPKYNLIWSLALWLWNAAPRRERRLLLYDVMLFTAMCPLIVLTTVLSFQAAETIFVPNISEKVTQVQDKLGLQGRREDVELIASLLARIIQMAIISLVMVIDVGFASWSVLRTQYHISTWYKWYRRSCMVLLRGYPDVSGAISRNVESTTNIRSVTF